MSTEKISKTTRQQKNSKFFVYYEEWTGEVLSVQSSQDHNSMHAYIETSNQCAIDIIRNTQPRSDFIVDIGEDDIVTIMKRTDYAVIKNTRDMVIEIPKKVTKHWDIRTTIYVKDKKMVVDLNSSSVKKIAAYNIKRQVVVGDNPDFTFYIVKKNDPDFIIDTVKVDANELIKRGSVTCDISAIELYCSIEDITIYTFKVLNNYYFTLNHTPLDHNTVNLDYTKKLTSITKHHTGDNGHIRLVQKGKEIICERMVPSNELLDAGLLFKNLTLFVVKSGSMDHYLGTLTINNSELQRDKTVILRNIPFKLDDVDILHQNPLLKITKENYKRD